MKGCEDFMLTVLHAHVVSAAKVILKTTQFENASDLAKEIVVRYTSLHPDIRETVCTASFESFTVMACIQHCHQRRR